VSLLAFFLSLAAGGILAGIAGSPFSFVAAVLVGIFLLFALKVANQWERAVVLRFGRFMGLKGPGLFILVPVVDQISQLGKQLQAILDEKTNPWGITVGSVEIRDVKIPAELEDAMSRQAQAERERQARIILGTAETEIAERFVAAGDSYKDHPLALHLRAMNMLYEAI
jgi:regulator of protease activity HflC (stomatin/prohibitin superfamily)